VDVQVDLGQVGVLLYEMLAAARRSSEADTNSSSKR